MKFRIIKNNENKYVIQNKRFGLFWVNTIIIDHDYFIHNKMYRWSYNISFLTAEYAEHYLKNECYNLYYPKYWNKKFRYYLTISKMGNICFLLQKKYLFYWVSVDLFKSQQKIKEYIASQSIKNEVYKVFSQKEIENSRIIKNILE